jgi:hypothetical protein
LSIARALCAILTWAAVCMSSAASAQPHAGLALADMSSGLQDEPGFNEIAGSNPCPRMGMEAPEDLGPNLLDERITLGFPAWFQICIESVRSDAVALAWAQGLDEHGAPLDASARASKLAEMEVWLRRLVGKFRIEGKRWSANRTNMQVLGTADCLGIGNGTGVSCVISADWKLDEKSGTSRNSTDPGTAIRPQVLLFGLDPGAMEIRVTHVDSIAVELHGILQDGAAILNERWPPEVVATTCPSRREIREAYLKIIATGRGVPPRCDDYLTSLNRLPMDWDGNFQKRLSRIAMTPGGEVDMKFYVFKPDTGFMRKNQAIEFDLQLHRELQVVSNVQAPPVAAEFTCVDPPGSGKERMPDEIETTSAGTRKHSGTREMQAWLERLIGHYAVEGHVDLCGNGHPEDQRPVTGKVDCIAAGSPPSVHCKVDVNWPSARRDSGAPLPGSVSNLSPAQFLFSVFTRERYELDGLNPDEPTGGHDRRGLQFMQLDNRNIAKWASSELVGDVFMARENCIDIPGDCHKTTRITAKPDGKEITLWVDVEMNQKRIARQRFLLHRESSIPEETRSTGSSR